MDMEAADKSISGARLKFSSKLSYGLGDLASNLC
jgi:Na+/melibiose symporter-like transporter